VANPEHVAKLKEGAEAWNAWRRQSDEKPNLSGVKLVGDSLDGYDFTATDFSKARFDAVKFWGANLDGCSFEHATILTCAFRYSHLERCDFKSATVGLVMFERCNLHESDFTYARLVGNAFSHVSLKAVRGLEALEFSNDNSIGIDTFFESGGLPASFLRGSGIPDAFIQYAASLVGKAIEYYSCFLSYSSKDDEFARRLYNDLQGKNIRTWFAPEDLKIGDRFRSRIDESIRLHDKLVLILSANSVASDWVESEVESALERERRDGKDVLFPIAIDEEGFSSQQPWAKDIRLKRHIGDFRKWKSHDDYTAAFERLVRDLKKSQPPIIMKGG
jgi:TIR domain/Pentapeptide repeats (9 copies)